MRKNNKDIHFHYFDVTSVFVIAFAKMYLFLIFYKTRNRKNRKVISGREILRQEIVSLKTDKILDLSTFWTYQLCSCFRVIKAILNS